MDYLHPAMVEALASVAPPPVKIDSQWLAFCKSQLSNARKQHALKPDWNPDKAIWQDEIIKLERDIEELKAGVQRDQLTSVKNWQMPEWGTKGT